jgi:uncharacterized protein DUF4190
MNEHPTQAAGYGAPPPGGYGPPGGGYGPPGGGYGSPPPGGFGPPPPPPGGFGHGGYGGGPPMGPMMQQPSTGLAIAALVCGILAIPGACCCYSSIPLGIAACIMGGIAMSKAKSSPETHGGGNLALAGLACGVVGLIGTVLLVALGLSMRLMEELSH